MTTRIANTGRFIVIVAAVLAAVIALWWSQVFMSPKRAYEEMLVNNLTTSSVTKSELSSSNGQSILQHVSFSLGGVNAARWLVTIQNNGGAVTTESIGTPTTGFVRYVEINDPKQSRDYSGVLNIWAKGDVSNGQPLKELFSQALLDVGSAPVPPLGNPTPEVRANLLDYIKDEAVFTPSFKNVKTDVINGRKVYVIRVSVKLAPYINMMRAFAQAYGLTSLDEINPADYQAAKPVELIISIDKLAHTMARVAYPRTGFVETYSGYGLQNTIRIPTETISTSQLDRRLKNVQR
jgi:hypothetical protein